MHKSNLNYDLINITQPNRIIAKLIMQAIAKYFNISIDDFITKKYKKDFQYVKLITIGVLKLYNIPNEIIKKYTKHNYSVIQKIYKKYTNLSNISIPIQNDTKRITELVVLSISEAFNSLNIKGD